MNPKTISVGPWGGKGGNSWDDGVSVGIRQIILVHGSLIDSISIEYERNGVFVWSKHGGRGGNNIGKIELDHPKERITSISGHYDTSVRSLTFESSEKKIYGPYGVEDGTYFSFSMAEGKIVGFHGRSGWYLDCIGVYISNLKAPEISKSLKPISVGPWGGKGGDMWDDGVYSGIHQIIIVYGDAIDSINIEYDNNGSEYNNNGSRFWLEHGGSTGNKIGKIQFDYPNEILTSISGHYDTYLRSLTFKSNLKKYGPYGRQQGTYFSFPISDGKIVGFHGRSGSYLDCIGVYLSNFNPVSPESNTVISIGPWGGKGGDLWNDGECAGIRQIILAHGRAIDSIQIEYERDGSSVWSRHGGRGGTKTDMIMLDYPRECLISISGHYENYLRSLSFESNLKKYGPYGVEQGTYFSFPMTEGRIVGFHGQSGWYLDSIGVYVSNFHYSIPSQIISVGPWGGKGGDGWYDGVYRGIRQIILVHGRVIDSINIEYDKDGRSVWSKHGGIGGTKTDKIQLDYPRESLTSISGYYDNCLTSLTLESNYKKYGPYGVQRGTYFSFPTEGKIVSFHGRSGWYLDCIGVYLSNLPAPDLLKSIQPISVGPWGGQGGEMWKDRVCSGIHQIIIAQGEFIDSIKIEYDRDGTRVWSSHGGTGGYKTHKIELDYPREYLTSFSGHYKNCVTSLSFESNLRKYGPYGVQQGTYFSAPLLEGKIVGFHGRSGWYLDCLGVYLSSLQTQMNSQATQQSDGAMIQNNTMCCKVIPDAI